MTGTRISEISLGTHALSGDGWGTIDDETSIQTIHAALDCGMNLIDTAHAYGLGHCEEVIGRALKGRRHEAVLCSKVGNCWDASARRYPDTSYDSIMRSIEAALARLQTDHLDIYMLHFPDPKAPIGESMRAMNLLRDQEIVRAVGVSRFGLKRLQAARDCGRIDIVEYPLNMLEDQFSMLPGLDETESVVPVLDYCQRNSIAVMAYGALAKGLLTGKFTGQERFEGNDQRRNHPEFQAQRLAALNAQLERLKTIANKHKKTVAQVAINWNLCQPGVTTSLVGARTPEQVKDNAAAAGWRLDDADLATISDMRNQAEGLRVHSCLRL